MKTAQVVEQVLPLMMTPEEVGKFLRISRNSVYRLVNEGKIPYVRVRGHIRFMKSSVEDYFRNQEVMPGMN